MVMQRVMQAVANPNYQLSRQDVTLLLIGLTLVERSPSHKARAQELQRILNTLQNEHGSLAISKGRL